MTKDDIVAGVKDAIIAVSKATASQIVLASKLKTFVPVQAAAGLALEIDERFPKVRPKELLNALFDDVKTVGDLVDFVADSEGV
jgi:hypothetical protein